MIAEDRDVPYTAARRSRRWTGILLAVLIAFLAGVALMAWVVGPDRLRAIVAREPALPPAAAPTAMTAMPLPQPAIAPPADPQALADAEALDERVASLEARIEGVGRRAQSAAGDAARAESLLVAFAARRALDGGIGLGYLEGQLRERFGETQPRAVAVIIAGAREPVTVEALQLRFEEIAPRLSDGEPGESWWQGARRGLAELVLIRRAGTPSPLSGERVTRARASLRAGRVDVAMAEVSRMPGRDAAAGWLAEARRYVAARRALDVIETTVLTQPQSEPLPALSSSEPADAPVVVP